MALGVVCANYNSLEATVLDMIGRNSKEPAHVIAFLFERLQSDARADWLKHCAKKKRVRDDVRACIELFADAFNICSKNRGLLVHAQVWAHMLGDDSALIVSKRERKHGRTRGYKFPLSVIRRVADEIHLWDAYAHHLQAYLNRRSFSRKRLPKGVHPIGPTTLPQKCDLPVDLLKNVPGTDNTPLHLPRSFEE